MRTQCKVLYVGKYSSPSFGPFYKFFVPYRGFLSFLRIWYVAYLNFHPFSPIFNHFYPFAIPLFSPPWGPREGRGDVAILNDVAIPPEMFPLFAPC